MAFLVSNQTNNYQKAEININNLGTGFINFNEKTIIVPKSNTKDAKNNDIVYFSIINDNLNIGSVESICTSGPEYGTVTHYWKGNSVIKLENKGQKYVDCLKYKLKIGDFVKMNNNEILKNFGNINQFKNVFPYIKDKYKIKTLNKFPFEDTDYTPDTINKRLDLTNEYIFTVDPTSSKDFDDAISIKTTEIGYQLGIHIADVSFFVKPNSILDEYAKKKMYTLYLNGDINHMLPFELSNNLCSLIPGEKRYTVSILINYNKRCELIDFNISRSIIKSKKRYTYPEVKNMIDNNSMDKNISMLHKFITTKYPEINEQFSMPIINIKLDYKLDPINMETEEYDLSHKIIEKCMIIANTLIAEKLNRRGDIFPYRCHEISNEKQLAKKNLYYKFSSDPLFRKTLEIKSYTNAYYNINNKEHYGLGLKLYCHFTSPIRRYIDLVIHRILLKEYIYTNEELEEICSLSNKIETSYVKAENEVINRQKNIILKNYNQVSGIIIDISKLGIKLQLTEFMMEKNIHISKLSLNRLEYDPIYKMLYNDNDNYILGKSITIGTSCLL